MGLRQVGVIDLCVTSENIAVDLDNCSRPLDLQRLFPQAAPLHLEIGAGKGTFLLNQARQNPHCNYLGIEWARKYYQYSVDRMRRWQITNVRIIRADAREFIAAYLPNECITGLHIYFPDPWPKKRHHKRRFFQPAVLHQVVRCLISDGQLRTATDHAEYFEIISDLVLNRPETARHFEPIEFFPADAAQPGEWVGSNFERKYLKEGRNIYTLALRKIQS
jgi:tRNA (guanine-N7-)-methyltransferase